MAITSKECDVGTLQLSSQEEVNRMVGGCITIRGGISISKNYTGSFVLPGVQNITDGLGTIWQPKTDTPSLTSVTLDDLVYADDLYFEGATALESVHLPSLQSVKSIEVNSRSPLSLSLPSLVNAASILLVGNFSR
jgi:hypothetical protein